MPNEKVTFPVRDLETIQDMTMTERDGLVEVMAERFGDRSAEAVAIALAMLFTTAMVADDPTQQRDTAGALNRFLAEAGLAWRLVPNVVDEAHNVRRH
jgi:hypothetical protein